MKGKALRKHSLHGKTAVSVLLKLFINGNERCHTTDATQRMSGTLFLKCKQHTIYKSSAPSEAPTFDYNYEYLVLHILDKKYLIIYM